MEDSCQSRGEVTEILGSDHTRKVLQQNSGCPSTFVTASDCHAVPPQSRLEREGASRRSGFQRTLYFLTRSNIERRSAVETQSQTQSPVPSSPKIMVWIGWGLSILIILALSMSASMKFSQPKELVEGMEKFGLPMNIVKPIGIVEVACTVLYAIPQTAVLGAILLTGYLGGATLTHVRINDAFAPPIIMGVMLWLGLYLRDARIRALVPWRK